MNVDGDAFRWPRDVPAVGSDALGDNCRELFFDQGGGLQVFIARQGMGKDELQLPRPADAWAGVCLHDRVGDDAAEGTKSGKLTQSA
ncbi:MAG TPA: hypothetical protein VF223_17920, partial [Trebonia sp.]